MHSYLPFYSIHHSKYSYSPSPLNFIVVHHFMPCKVHASSKTVHSFYQLPFFNLSTTTPPPPPPTTYRLYIQYPLLSIYVIELLCISQAHPLSIVRSTLLSGISTSLIILSPIIRCFITNMTYISTF